MENHVKQWLRDWWRGYSMRDQLSMIDKFSSAEASKPDGIIELTQRELRAMNAASAFLDRIR